MRKRLSGMSSFQSQRVIVFSLGYREMFRQALQSYDVGRGDSGDLTRGVCILVFLINSSVALFIVLEHMYCGKCHDREWKKRK